MINSCLPAPSVVDLMSDCIVLPSFSLSYRRTLSNAVIEIAFVA